MSEEQFKKTLQTTLQEMMGIEVHVVSASEMEKMLDNDSADDDSVREEAAREKEATRQRALRNVRTAQADLLKRYDMLKALEKSIDTPAAERTPKHTLDEIMLVLSLKGL